MQKKLFTELAQNLDALPPNIHAQGKSKQSHLNFVPSNTHRHFYGFAIEICCYYFLS